MNRKTLTAIVLTVSIILNFALIAFAYIQNGVSQTIRIEAASIMKELQTVRQQTKAELDQCEGLRAQSDAAREECEKKILAISNRKK